MHRIQTSKYFNLFTVLLIVGVAGITITLAVRAQLLESQNQQENEQVQRQAFEERLLTHINRTITHLINDLDRRAVIQNDYRNTTLELQNLLSNVTYGLNVQVSQHGIHTDAGLGSLNGNLTKLIKSIDNYTNEILKNQEEFLEPYLNATFDKIFKALNITQLANEK
jgi:anaerobic ribonucleoside-triphosphate reductase